MQFNFSVLLRLKLFASRLSLPRVTGFPALRVLQLKNCYLFNDDLSNDFFKSCPLLEDLHLVCCETYYLDSFCISCPKLKTLRIDNRKTPDVFQFDNFPESKCTSLDICCPNLVFLEFAGFMAEEFMCESLNSLKKSTIYPQDTFEWTDKKLCELFPGISHVESLLLCIFSIQKPLDLQDFPESLPNLKTLELISTIDAFDINLLIQILVINQGSLETLFPTEDEDEDDDDDDLGFLMMNNDYKFERVKMVNMMGISAVPHHMRFIEFLLKSTPVLETMIITPSINMNDGTLSFLTDALKFQRASTKAEIILSFKDFLTS